MQFVFQPFLWALAALAVPIIIHLFYFRRFKKVYFTNVRFLREVRDETNSARKLKNFLVLLMRCLAMAMLVLAFAQPFIPAKGAVQRGQKSVSVYVDNSFSMRAESKEATLLDVAKIRAKEIVQAYAPDDRFQVLTNDFEGRHQRLVGRDDALELIEQIAISPTTRSISKVLQRQKQALNTGAAEHEIAYLLSDFQENTSDPEGFRDTTLELNLVPMTAVQERNISIDTLWFENPVKILNQPAKLVVQVSNRSDEPAEEVRMSIHYDGQTKPVGELNINARGTVTDTVSFNILKAGFQEGMLSISDFPIEFDNNYYFSFEVSRSINVLEINGGTPSVSIKNSFAGAPYFKLDNNSPQSINYSDFGKYRLIILHEVKDISSGLASELKGFMSNGGNVLIFPSENGNLESYSRFLQSIEAGNLGALDRTKRQVASINTEAAVFSDVFLNKKANLRLPNTEANFKMASGRGEPILTYRDGTPMMAKYTHGEGAAFFCASPLDVKLNDLSRNGEIFVPMLFNLAISGTKAQKAAYTIGKDALLEAKHAIRASGETIYKLKGFSMEGQREGSVEEFIPEQRILGAKVQLTPQEQISSAGWYRLFLQQDSTLANYAFNYDRRESDLRYADMARIAEELPSNFNLLDSNEETNFTNYVETRNQGIVLWRWCLLFSLLFLALEALLLRFWRV